MVDLDRLSQIPQSPADCADALVASGLTLTRGQRELLVAQIGILINQRVQAAVVAAIQEAHAAVTKALIAPITEAEIDKALSRTSS